MRLRAAHMGHSHGRCRPAGCWSVWVYQRRRSASSTGRLWPESPGDSGLGPAWRGQPYRQPATTSCGRRTCAARHTNNVFMLWTCPGIYLRVCNSFVIILLARGTKLFFLLFSIRKNVCVCVCVQVCQNGKLPVTFVVYRQEVHQEHVVRHGIHSKYFHLESWKHSPGKGRKTRRGC